MTLWSDILLGRTNCNFVLSVLFFFFVKYRGATAPTVLNSILFRKTTLYQSEGLTERINEPPWGRCLQGAVDARWVVVVVFGVLLLLSSSPRITSSRALGSTVTLLRSNGVR